MGLLVLQYALIYLGLATIVAAGAYGVACALHVFADWLEGRDDEFDDWA